MNIHFLLKVWVVQSFLTINVIITIRNTAGFKVWPTEVESVLYNHPAINEACVISAPDKIRGETVKAVVTLKNDYKGKIKPEDLIDWTKDKLANYKYPRIVEFRESLPMTSSGKILWRQLQEESYKGV